MVNNLYGSGGYFGYVTKATCINFGYLTIRRHFFCGSFVLFMSCVCHVSRLIIAAL